MKHSLLVLLLAGCAVDVGAQLDAQSAPQSDAAAAVDAVDAVVPQAFDAGVDAAAPLDAGSDAPDVVDAAAAPDAWQCGRAYEPCCVGLVACFGVECLAGVCTP